MLGLLQEQLRFPRYLSRETERLDTRWLVAALEYRARPDDHVTDFARDPVALQQVPLVAGQLGDPGNVLLEELVARLDQIRGQEIQQPFAVERERVDAADTAQLEAWAKRLFTAESPEAVFA